MLIKLGLWSFIEYFLPRQDTPALVFACKSPVKNPLTTIKLPNGEQMACFVLIPSALESIRHAE